MAETLDGSALADMLAPPSASMRGVEVAPEMLDYDFVEKCQDRDELQAVHRALVAGEHGRFPHLEKCVRDKLASLARPRDDGPSVPASSTTESQSLEESDARNRNALGNWLDGLATTKRPPQDDGGLPMTRDRADLPPVRTIARGVPSSKEEYESAVADFERAHVLDPSAGYDRIVGASNREMIGETRESQTFHSLTIEEFDGDEEGFDRPLVGVEANVANVYADAPARRDPPPPSCVVDEGGTRGATATTGPGDDAKYNDSLLKRVEVELVEDDAAIADAPVPSPNADAMKLKEEGNAALRRGDAQSAVRFYDASLELEPKNAVVLNNRARAHSNLGQWDKALEDSGMNAWPSSPTTSRPCFAAGSRR